MRFCLIAGGKVGFRLPDAARLLGKEIAGERMGTGTGSAADLPEFTDATFTFQVFRVAQSNEERRAAIKLGE